jgi:hypothetical protein
MNLTTFGKICGWIGVAALIGSLYTYFVISPSATMAGGEALAGVILIGAFFATNYAQLGQFASSRASFFMATSVVTTLFVIGALVAVNYIAAKKDKTWDLTQKKIYTLAPQTKTALKELKQKVNAIGFVQSTNPYYDALQNLFERYHREAPEKFEYAFKDPKRNPDLAAKYQLKEGQATVVLTRGEGANESHTALNVVSENELTNALIKINAVGEQKVYFVQGHGEWTLEPVKDPNSDVPGSVSELKTTLIQEGYAPQALNLAGQTDVPKDASLVIIAGSQSKLAAPEVDTLKKYMAEGGRLLFFAEAQKEAGVDSILKEFGVELDPGVIADDHFAVSSPYVVLSQFYGDHEITKLLKEMSMVVEFPASRGLTVLHEGLEASVKPTPVVLTSPYAWEESHPDDNPQRSDGEKTGQIPLVVASTQNTASATNKRFDEARLCAFGNAEIIIDSNWGHDPNRNLVMNAIAWATQQVSKITIRPPDRDISTIDLDKDMLERIRFVATDLFPLSLIGLGLAIWVTRRNK